MASELPRLEVLHVPDCWGALGGKCDCVGGRLTAAVQAVLDLHRPDHLGCNECGETRRAWPCPTVRAICEALEVSDGPPS